MRTLYRSNHYLSNLLFIIILSIVTPTILQAQDDNPINQLKILFPTGKNSVEIPFQSPGSIPIISVSINSAPPCRMTFDTGSQTPLIYGSIDPKPFNLEIKGQTEINGAGSGAGILADIAGNVTYAFSGVQLFGSELVVLPKVETDQINKMQSDGIAGTIGRPVFEKLIVEMDWEKQRIIFSDPQSYHYSGKGSILPLTFDEAGIPYTTATVSIDGKTSIPVKMLIDTGADHAMSLDVGSNPAIKVPQKNLGNGSATGLTGSYKLQTALARKIKLGNYTLNDVTTSFIDTASDQTAMMGGRQGLLGSELLRRFRVIFDYPHQRMILEPQSNLNHKFPYSLSGFRSKRSPQTKNLLITEIIDGSEAKKTGLLVADEIVAINGVAPIEITSEELFKLFREENKLLRLTLNRQGKQITKSFRLKRFL